MARKGPSSSPALVVLTAALLFAGAGAALPTQGIVGQPVMDERTDDAPAPHCELGEQTLDRLWPEPDQTTSFISWDDAVCGLEVLNERHPDLVELVEVSRSVGWADRIEGDHDRFPVYAIELTDETVEDKRGNLIFITSIHGNEKGAREGILRSFEDLLIGQGIAPQVEANTGMSIAEVLQELRLVFFFPNPDGWVHEELAYRLNDACYVSVSCGAASEPGEIGVESQNFVRVNGNGTDLNRQYPTTGALFTGKEQMTEPEIKGFVDYVNALPEPTLAGVDLHGMLDSEALNYLLIKDTQRTLLEVAQHEALAKVTAQRMAEDPDVQMWEATGGPPVIWGSTIDLLGYSAPGTGGAYIVQDTGFNAAGFTIEQTFSHITFDNWYQGPGQAMNIMHVASMRATVAAFIEYALARPDAVTLTGDANVGYLSHPALQPGARFDGTDADPDLFFHEVAGEGAAIQELDGLAPAALAGLTHVVVPAHTGEQVRGHQAKASGTDGASLADPVHDILHPWIEEGGTLVLTDSAAELAVELGLASGVEVLKDFTGRVHTMDEGHWLAAGTNTPVRTIVDGNPLGYDAGTVPIHCLTDFEGERVGTRSLGGSMDPTNGMLGPVGPAPGETCTVVGHAKLGAGQVVVIGAALLDPLEPPGPYGVDGYALTPNGARILLNAMGYGLEGIDPASDDAAPAAGAGGAAGPAEDIPAPGTVAALVALGAVAAMLAMLGTRSRRDD